MEFSSLSHDGIDRLIASRYCHDEIVGETVRILVRQNIEFGKYGDDFFQQLANY